MTVRPPALAGRASVVLLLGAALAVATIVLASSAPVASAQTVSVVPEPVSPANGAAHTAGGAPPTFRVRSQAGDYYLWVHVSRSPTTDAKGIIGSDVTLSSLSPSAGDGSIYEHTPVPYAFPGYWLVTPGTYYWQAYRISYMNGADGAIEGPVHRLDVTAAPAPPAPPVPAPVAAPPTTASAPDPFAGLSSAVLPSWIGSRSFGVSYAVSAHGLPAGVSRDRWLALARAAGSRWGMTVSHETYGSPYSGDGAVELGFGYVAPGSLGVQTDLIATRYRKARRVCTRKWVRSAGRLRRVKRCHRRKRSVVSRRLVDADVTISNSVALRWQQGPAKPTPWEFDLQSVLIHELGHLSGNEHTPLCENTPMVAALDKGEWWHSPDDFSFIGCGAYARAAKGRAAQNDSSPAGRLEHRTRVVAVDVDATPTAASDHVDLLERVGVENRRNEARQDAGR